MDNPSDTAGSVKPPAESKHTVLMVFAASFGVILPAATMAIEAFTGMCADTFFDPMPTLLHAVMIALVPVGNLLGLIAMYNRGNVRLRNAAMVVMAVSIMVSGYYSLIFLPILPFAAIGILFMGMGLLPMSPHLSFIMTILLRRQLRILLSRMLCRVQGSGSLCLRPCFLSSSSLCQLQ